MLIENGLADAVDSFHLDALSSAVGLKVDFDATLTEVPTGLYRTIARQLPGNEAPKGRHIFRHFLDAPAQIEIDAHRVESSYPNELTIPSYGPQASGKKPSRFPGGTTGSSHSTSANRSPAVNPIPKR